jgi:hypothetical protein
MRLSIDSLLSDIEEYFVDNSDPYPHRYKRLDPRGLLGRAYTLIAELDEKVDPEKTDSHLWEDDEEEYDEEYDPEQDEEEIEDEDGEAVDNVDGPK